VEIVDVDLGAVVDAARRCGTASELQRRIVAYA
jgi:hypothetical protein